MTSTEALERAQSSSSPRNEAEVIAGFIRRGIPEADIIPRVNVLPYNAWRAKGRQVRRGERGVQILTWIRIPDRTSTTGDVKRGGMRPKRATVFHVTQTD